MSETSTSTESIEVSIILPVYNVEDYIEECIESILKQKFSYKYEIILVNDASTDNSGGVIQKYANHENLVYVELEENQGSSVARNTGIEHSKGNYLLYVDPDDILAENALQILHDTIKHHDADIVKGNNTIFNMKKENAAGFNVNETVVLENEAILSTFFDHDKMRGHPWGKLFKRSNISDVRFTKGYAMAQDLLYCTECFSKAKKCVLIPDNVYRYRLRETGSTGKKYIKESYIWWLNAVEQSGKFAHNQKLKKHHRSLMIRTLLQITKECRSLDTLQLSKVLDEIENRKKKWGITATNLFFKGNLSLKNLHRFLVQKLTYKKLKTRTIKNKG